MSDRYAAFLSYSHGDAAECARSLRRALEGFACKPWQQRRFRIWHDDASLTMTPALWTNSGAGFVFSTSTGTSTCTGTRRSQLTGSLKDVRQASYAREALALLAGRGVHVFDLASGRQLSHLQEPALVTSVHLSRDGRTITITAKDGTLSVRQAQSGQLIEKMKKQSSVRFTAHSHDEAHFVAPELRGTIELIQLGERRAAPLETSEGVVSAAAFAPDDLSFALGTGSGEVSFWSVASGEQLARFAIGSATVLMIEYAPDGSSVAALGADGRAYVYPATFELSFRRACSALRGAREIEVRAACASR